MIDSDHYSPWWPRRGKYKLPRELQFAGLGPGLVRGCPGFIRARKDLAVTHVKTAEAATIRQVVNILKGLLI